MTKRRNKKRTLMASILSLILCISMLLGTTMAWFTDTVSNTGNRIVTGELGVQLLKYDGTDYVDISTTDDGKGDIFTTEGPEGERLTGTLWEPGKTEVVLLQVKNTKSLALNYNIVLDAANETDAALEEVLSYAIISKVAGKDVGEANVAKYSDFNITSWQGIEELQGVEIGAVSAGTTKTAHTGALLAGESDYFALAVHMDEEAGNEYQNQSIKIDVKVEAKQMPYEEDSFGNQYDADAEYSDRANVEYPSDGIFYHVSTTGDDSNPGTEEEPFATIAKANEVISALDHEGATVQVLIHGGTYMLTESIVFNGTAAGGTEKNKVIYRAAGDGEVVFSGYQQIPTADLSSVEDGAVKDLIPEEAQPYVMKVDLGVYGLDYTDLNLVEGKSRDNNPRDLLEHYTLLLNGKEQNLAQWPNYGEVELFSADAIVDAGERAPGGKAPTFKYAYSNIDNWTENSLAQAVVRGYLSTTYREEWNQIANVDTDAQTVTLKYGTDFGMNTKGGWSIENMLEELDVPGEYCIDYKHSGLALYYYPPYDLSDNDYLELSVVKDVALICKDTQFVVFDGIKFTGFRNSDTTQGIITLKNSDNIEIRNCTFTYNDGCCNIAITGNNNIVEACGFYNCGAPGVYLYGGADYNTLEKQNNVISNNHFYNVGYQYITNNAGAIFNNYFPGDTIGNVIKNNLIHHIYKNVNIKFSGLEYDISYNEISNGLRNVSDYGLIYVGYNAASLGNTINHNYLHDFGSYRNTAYSTYGIYLDDWQSGQTVMNNIVVPKGTNVTGISSIGAYNTIKYNIVADSTWGIWQGDRNRTSTYGADVLALPNSLKEKYPFILNIPVEEENLNGIFPIIGNVISDNIAYNSTIDVHKKAVANGTVENNVVLKDATGVFVDPNNHDWRLTSEYAVNVSENFLTEDNFQMDEIGIQKDVWDIKNPLDSFKQVYPKNGATDVQFDEIVLNWEQALFADEYKYVVATDAEMTNVVASGTSAYEHVNISLPAGTTYYWKVTAVNTTRQLGAEWASESEAFSFTTAMKEVDRTILNETIAEATTLFTAVEDAQEPVVGGYKPGTKVKLDAVLQEANTMAGKQDATQEEVDAEVVRLRRVIDGIDAYQYKGYATLDTSNADKWKSNNTNTTVTVEEGVITINGKKAVAYTDTLPNCNLITFDIKPTLAKGYMAFTFRTVYPDVENVYNGTSYLLWIKASGLDDDHIELQKNPYGNDGPEMLIKTPNTDIVKDGEWHNFQIATESLEEGGVRIIFKVNGEVIFDFVDNSETSQYSPVYEDGSIAFQTNQSRIDIRAAATIPTDIYEDLD